MPVLTAHLLFSVTLAGFVVAHAQEAIRVDPAQDSPLSSFRQALNSAWKRSLQASEARGRNLRAHADQQVSERWLAGPVALRLGEREVLANGSASSRETDFGLALPLWRLGQRDAAGQAAQSQSVWTQAFEQAERLRLAGLLRDAIAAVHLADVDLQQALQQAETIGQSRQVVSKGEATEAFLFALEDVDPAKNTGHPRRLTRAAALGGAAIVDPAITAGAIAQAVDAVIRLPFVQMACQRQCPDAAIFRVDLSAEAAARRRPPGGCRTENRLDRT